MISAFLDFLKVFSGLHWQGQLGVIGIIAIAFATNMSRRKWVADKIVLASHAALDISYWRGRVAWNMSNIKHLGRSILYQDLAYHYIEELVKRFSVIAAEKRPDVSKRRLQDILLESENAYTRAWADAGIPDAVRVSFFRWHADRRLRMIRAIGRICDSRSRAHPRQRLELIYEQLWSLLEDTVKDGVSGILELNGQLDGTKYKGHDLTTRR